MQKIYMKTKHVSTHSMEIHWDIIDDLTQFGNRKVFVSNRIKFDGIDTFVQVKFYKDESAIELLFDGKQTQQNAFFDFKVSQMNFVRCEEMMEEPEEKLLFTKYSPVKERLKVSNLGIIQRDFIKEIRLKLEINLYLMLSLCEPISEPCQEENIDEDIRTDNVLVLKAKKRKSSENFSIGNIDESDSDDDYSVLSLESSDSDNNVEVNEEAAKCFKPDSGQIVKNSEKKKIELMNKRFDKLLPLLEQEFSGSCNWMDFKNLPPVLKETMCQTLAEKVDETNFYEFLLLADSVDFNVLEEMTIDFLISSFKPEELFQSDEWMKLKANDKHLMKIQEKLMLKLWKMLDEQKDESVRLQQNVNKLSAEKLKLEHKIQKLDDEKFKAKNNRYYLSDKEEW